MSGYKHLSSLERDRIADLRASGQGVRAIARALKRSGSTISRELRRNALPSGAWRPTYADGAYLDRRQRPALLETDKRLRAFVVDRLMEGWTPEQISGWLRRGVEKGLASLSPEAIYAFLYRPAQKDEKLWRALPRRRPRRKRLRARRAHEPIKGKVHISERSEPAEARAEAGHWEADLVICKRSKPVLVLHERKTRLTLMARLAGKTAAETVSTMMAIFKRLPKSMRGSIAFDNGGEFALHALLKPLLSDQTYFCDPYASWQKGGVENANGRIRRWMPRNIDLDDLSDADIQEIALTLNLTPRKCLAFKSPLEAFFSDLGFNPTFRFNSPVALRP